MPRQHLRHWNLVGDQRNPQHSRSWLCRPPAAIDTFSPFDIGIHKITPQHVANKPRFHEVWPEVLGLPNNKLPTVTAALGVKLHRRSRVRSAHTTYAGGGTR